MPAKYIPVVLLVIVLWSFNAVAVKVGIQDIPPLLMTTLRYPIYLDVRRPHVQELAEGNTFFQMIRCWRWEACRHVEGKSGSLAPLASMGPRMVTMTRTPLLYIRTENRFE